MIRLLLVREGEEGPAEPVEVTTPTLAMGRSPLCELVLDDDRVSGSHGRMLWRDGGWLYEDLRSTNGSLVRRGGRDLAVEPAVPVPVQDGDRLLLGDRAHPIVLRVELSGVLAEALGGAGATVVASRDALRPPRLTLGESRTARLLEVFRALASSPGDPTAVVRHVGDFLFELCPGAHLVLLEMAGGAVAPDPLLLRRGEGRATPGPPVPAGLRRAVLDEGAALHVTDLAPAAGTTESVVGLDIASALVAPLRVRDRSVGVMLLGGGTGRDGFSVVDLDVFTAVAHHMAALVENARLVGVLEESEDRLRTENRFLRTRMAGEGFVGESAVLRETIVQLDAVAPTDTTVLLLGETGTGKELLAQAIHRRSRRKDGPLLTVNCGALASGVLESELFGHVRGAFTGADRDKPGLFEVASGGTLFLDEIGEMPPEHQVRLLRVLQEGEVTPVGGRRPRRVDVRVICATNRDLQALVEQGAFREDLYYRLSVFPLTVPPLRDRRGDVPLLARHFLADLDGELSKGLAGFSSEALDVLGAWRWPGNVRELRNEVERAALLAPPTGLVEPEHLSMRLRTSPGLPEVGPLKEAMGRVEGAYLAKALEAHGGNRSATARALGISRQALLAKIRKYGLA